MADDDDQPKRRSWIERMGDNAVDQANRQAARRKPPRERKPVTYKPTPTPEERAEKRLSKRHWTRPTVFAEPVNVTNFGDLVAGLAGVLQSGPAPAAAVGTLRLREHELVWLIAAVDAAADVAAGDAGVRRDVRRELAVALDQLRGER